jgi:hypothetical protein
MRDDVMREIWAPALCFVLAMTDAKAASPEERYFAARDAYVAKFATIHDDLKLDAASWQAKARLTQLLRPIIGPVTIKGFRGDGESNVTSFNRQVAEGFAKLDGLEFGLDHKTYAVVTTVPLLRHWLREHRKDGLPRAIDAALESEGLYNEGVTSGNIFAKYADLPIAKPAGASLALAVLGLRNTDQDVGLKGAPNEINVAVVQDERVFVVRTEVTSKIDPIPECDRTWEVTMAKPVDENDGEGLNRRDREADAPFISRFTKNAPSQPFFGDQAGRGTGRSAAGAKPRAPKSKFAEWNQAD